ncbi:MAG: hypothetical protein ACREA0_01615 [bacterium]
MTREEILKKFTVNEHGIIQSPGKFEGEMLYAPYFYDATLDGRGEDVYNAPPASEDEEVDDPWEGGDLLYTELEVTAEDREMFPELDPSTQRVRVSESGPGFVYVEEVL